MAGVTSVTSGRNIALRYAPAKGGERNVEGVYIYKYIYPDVTLPSPAFLGATA